MTYHVFQCIEATRDECLAWDFTKNIQKENQLHSVYNLKKRDPTLRKGHKSVDNPRKQNQTPPFPVSSFPPSRCCSISGRMLMPAAFLWCVTRSKTKLRHKHFLDLLILTLYIRTVLVFYLSNCLCLCIISNFDWTLIYQNVVAFC